jgi:phasin family protein
MQELLTESANHIMSCAPQHDFGFLMSKKSKKGAGTRVPSTMTGLTVNDASEDAPEPQVETRRISMNMNFTNDSIKQMEDTTQGLMKAYEEIGAVARDHMDAAIRSANAAWGGYTEISQNMNGLFQESLARAVSAGKTMMSAATVREIMDMHADYVKDCFDCWVAGTGKLSEISARVSKEAFDPLAQQTNDAIAKMMQKAKAA